MAADSRDPITGAYIFSDAGAPDIAVDPTLISAQANDVGTRIVRPTLAELDAYTYEREGLQGGTKDTSSEYLHDGTGWVLMHRAPQPYTPILSNITGSPTVTARYSVASGWAHVSMLMVLTGANVGTAPGFSLPVTARTPSGFQMLGQALYRKSGNWCEGGVLLADANSVAPVLKLVSGALINMSTNVNASSPFAWASGDSMTLQFSYEVA